MTRTPAILLIKCRQDNLYYSTFNRKFHDEWQIQYFKIYFRTSFTSLFYISSVTMSWWGTDCTELTTQRLPARISLEARFCCYIHNPQLCAIIRHSPKKGWSRRMEQGCTSLYLCSCNINETKLRSINFSLL